MAQKATQNIIVNGVNVTRLFETVDKIKENKGIGKFNFRAKNKWLGGMSNQTTVSDFYGACQTHKRSRPHIFTKDEPEVLLGHDQGANPVEYLLAGLAGCVTTSLVAHAAAKGIKIDSIEATLDGDIDIQGLLQIDKDVNPGYQGIRISYKIESDAPEETLKELIELAEKSSPVANTIKRPTPIYMSLVK